MYTINFIVLLNRIINTEMQLTELKKIFFEENLLQTTFYLLTESFLFLFFLIFFYAGQTTLLISHKNSKVPITHAQNTK